MAFEEKKFDTFEKVSRDSSQETELFSNSFKLFDTQNTGYANPKELIKCFLQIDSGENHKTILQIIGILDKYVRDDKMLTFKDFVHIIQCPLKPSSEEPLGTVPHLFQLLASHETGAISTESLMQTCMALGEELTKEDVESMIKCADSNKDGFVNFEEFSELILKIKL